MDALKLNLNADLRGPTRAKMDDELRMALKGPALTLRFSAPVLGQTQISTAFGNRSSAFAPAPEPRTASEARHPFLHTDHAIPSQCPSAAVRGLTRPSPRVFNPDEIEVHTKRPEPSADASRAIGGLFAVLLSTDGQYLEFRALIPVPGFQEIRRFFGDAA